MSKKQHRWCTLSEKIRNGPNGILRGLRERKISRHCPFKKGLSDCLFLNVCCLGEWNLEGQKARRPQGISIACLLYHFIQSTAGVCCFTDRQTGLSASFRLSYCTANEGPVSINIQYECLVPIYVFPEMKLLFPKQIIMFCLPVPSLIYL